MADEWLDAAIDSAPMTSKQFKQVRNDVESFKEFVNERAEKLDELEAKLDSIPGLSTKEKSQALAYIKGMREGLEGFNQAYKKFDDYSKEVDDGLEKVVAFKEFRDRNREMESRSGNLSEQTRGLALLLEKAGDKLDSVVPGVGKMIAEYGKITGELLHASQRIEQQLQSNIHQGAIGEGAPGLALLQDSKVKKGEARLDAIGVGLTMFPTHPPMLYTIVGGNGRGMLWDEGEQEWYDVRNVEDMRRLYVLSELAENPFDANQLHHIYHNPEVAKKLMAEAAGIQGIFKELEQGLYSGTLPERLKKSLWTKHADYSLRRIVSRKYEFLARYVFGRRAAFRNQAKASFAAMHDAIRVELASRKKRSADGDRLHVILVRMHGRCPQGVSLTPSSSLIASFTPGTAVKTKDFAVEITLKGVNRPPQAGSVQEKAIFYCLEEGVYEVSLQVTGLSKEEPNYSGRARLTIPHPRRGFGLIKRKYVVGPEGYASLTLRAVDSASDDPLPTASFHLLGPAVSNTDEALFDTTISRYALPSARWPLVNSLSVNGAAASASELVPGMYRYQVTAPGYKGNRNALFLPPMSQKTITVEMRKGPEESRPGRIDVKIVNADNMQPIGGASITLVEREYGQDFYGGTAEGNGIVSINNIVPGHYRMTGSADRYQQRTVKVDLSQGAKGGKPPHRKGTLPLTPVPQKKENEKKGEKEQAEIVVREDGASMGLVSGYVKKGNRWGTATSYPVSGPGTLRMQIVYTTSEESWQSYDFGHGQGGLKWTCKNGECASGSVRMPRMIGRVNGDWAWKGKVEASAGIQITKKGTVTFWAWPESSPARQLKNGKWTDDLHGATHTHALGGTMAIKFTFIPDAPDK